MEQDLMNRGLPKWPMMLVTGTPISPWMAKEVIRRTDRALGWLDYAGNDHALTSRLKEMFKHETTEEWRAKWGFVDTHYVTNSWISCSFVYGPHGWCHPSGQIGFVDNVGKWPDVKDILEDWTTLAHVFPFLNLGITLFDKESCEDDRKKVVSIRVLDGEAYLVDPEKEDVHAGHPEATRNDTGVGEEDFFKLRYGTPDHGLSRECGVPHEWFEEWASKHAR